MRLYSVKLDNYIGIYNGLGLETISIDFSKCKNNIVVIKGDNGSGKSTIFNALTPFADGNQTFIPNKPAMKKISYIMDNNDIIEITYHHPISASGERKQAKCFIHKISTDGANVDLNPNGNITEGKDMINTIFDFDPTFVTLSQLSSEDRGLADKKPAERKKLINSIMESLSSYNDIYKKLSKKSSAIKSMITSINSKIQSIGDISTVQSKITQLEETLGNQEDRKNELIFELGKHKSKLDKYNVNTLIEEYKDLSNKRDSLPISNINITEKDYDNLNIRNDEISKELINLNQIMNISDSNIKSITPIMQSLHTNIEDILSKLEVYDDIGVEDDLKKAIHDRTVTLNNYINNKNSILASIKKSSKKKYDEVYLITENVKQKTRELNNCILTINHNLFILEDVLSLETILNKVLNKVEYVSLKTDVAVLYDELRKLEKTKDDQDKFREESEGYSSIPNKCNSKDICPFVSNIVKSKSKCLSENDYNNLCKSIISLKDGIDIANHHNKIQDVADKIESIISSIMINYNENKDIYDIILPIDLSNINALEQIIMNGKELVFDFDKINDLNNLNTLIESERVSIDTLNSQLKELCANKELITHLNDELNKAQDTYIDCLAKDKEFKANFKSASDKLNELQAEFKSNSDTIQRYEANLGNLTLYNEFSSKLEELSIQINEAKDINAQIQSYEQEINTISDRIPKITDELNRLKYSIILYNDYLKEYKEFSSKYNTIEVVKKYASPTTGIQTVFMNIYLNDIINISNQLLQMLFNGEYVIHPFIINETEFKIPCSGSGLLNDDISSMSSAQISMISMIISFALLQKSSSIYNIIKLDEIDAPLDTNNRLIFSELLIKIMGILNSQQCVMISHNAELGMINSDIILLKNSDPNLKLDGNIIYKY